MSYCIHCHEPQTVTAYCSLGWYRGNVEHARYETMFIAPGEIV